MSNVSVKVHPPGGTIVMDRPQLGNAMSKSLMSELEQAFDDLHQEKRVRYVILTGSGEQFCTGLDLCELRELTEAVSPETSDAVHELWVQAGDLLQKMLRYPKPIVAAVDGKALGAGLALVLASDLCVCTSRSHFGAPATRIGLLSGLVAPLLAFRLGGSLAARLVLTGKEIDSQEAKTIGLTSDVVRPEQVWVVADQLGKMCAVGPAEAVQMSKRLLNETIGEMLVAHLTIGAGMGATICSTDSAKEGLDAFGQKRDPKWM